MKQQHKIIFKYRKFIPEDVLDIKKLMTYLEYNKNIENLKRDISLFLSFSLNRIYVAEHNKEVIGYIAIAAHHLLVTDFFRFRIENLVVSPHYRKKGIAKELISLSELHAISCKASIIDLTSSLKRKGVYTFYEKCGYKNDGKEERRYFRKRLIENEILNA